MKYYILRGLRVLRHPYPGGWTSPIVSWTSRQVHCTLHTNNYTPHLFKQEVSSDLYVSYIVVLPYAFSLTNINILRTANCYGEGGGKGTGTAAED